MSTNASSSSSTAFTQRYGPWAVVTGASSGIGKAAAVHLAASGLNLVVVARNPQALDAIAAELGPARLRVVAADLSRSEGLQAVEAACADLDVGLLVAAAGFGTSGPFLRADVEAELGMLDLNCRAVTLQALHFGRRLATRGSGGIVLFGSLVGFQGTPQAAHYAATKAYVQTLAEGLRFELAPHGVDVLASAPGPVRTGFAARAGLQMGAAASPERVARVTLAALGRRTTVLPGALTKVLSYSLAPLPRPLRARIMGQVMAGMTKHRHGNNDGHSNGQGAGTPEPA